MATKCGALYQGMTAVYANTDCLLVSKSSHDH